MKVFFLLLALSGFPFIVQGQEIVLMADQWEPYNGSPAASNPGYVVEMVKEIFEKKGMTVKYQIAPWNRAIMEAENGKANAIIGALKTEVPQFIFPDEEIGLSSNAFFVRKDSPWKYQGTDSLSTEALGTISDYSYGPAIDDYINKNKADSKKVQSMFGVNPLEQNILKLMKKRISVIVEDRNVFQFRLNQMKLTGEVVEAGHEKAQEIYLAFSPAQPRSAELAKIFTQGIRELRASGKLQKILAKYGLKDWK